MKSSRLFISFLLGILLIMFISSCNGIEEDKAGDFYIGWAMVDITPDQPALISGQFHARVSEGVMDPVTATALAIESGTGPLSEKVIMISVDLSTIRDGSRDGSKEHFLNDIRNLVINSIPQLRPEQIVLNATHTHSGPYYGVENSITEAYGVELEAMTPYDCQKFLAEPIAKAAEEAWNAREPGGISYGLGHAVVGHNRLQTDLSGQTRMYGSIDRPEFSHIEGFEDHSVHLLYTWDNRSDLTGVMINVAAPSQVSEHAFEISADFWHDTKVELRERLGKDIYVFAQCSAAGDKSPHVMVETKAEERMQQLKFPDDESGRGSIGRRKQIATRLSDAVTSVLPHMKDNIEWDPVFAHKMEAVELSRRLISMDDVNDALEESAKWEKQYEELLKEIEENPEIKEESRWYTDITRAYRRTRRGQNVKERYELEKIEPTMPTEVHVIRIGDIVIATNQFELYLDYGIRIKGRSPAPQTFIVQLAGWGTYLPTPRSIEGGAYGAVPASTLIGPEGGEKLVERTLEMINAVWEK